MFDTMNGGQGLRVAGCWLLVAGCWLLVAQVRVGSVWDSNQPRISLRLPRSDTERFPWISVAVSVKSVVAFVVLCQSRAYFPAESRTSQQPATSSPPATGNQ